MAKDMPSKERVRHSTETAKSLAAMTLGVSLFLFGVSDEHFLATGFEAGLVTGIGTTLLLWGGKVLLKK